MTIIESRLNRETDQYKENQRLNLDSIGELVKNQERVLAGGGEKSFARHVGKGKLLPRERISKLLDVHSPFLELLPFAGIHQGGVPGGALICGLGYVHGQMVMVSASDATIQGGAIGAIGVQKSARIAEIARENELPMIHLVESAGADLPNQVDIFVPGGANFREITRRSESRLPTISLVFGSCTAGGAYIPGMSDYSVMVDGAAYMFLAGPPLVKMATGEVVDDETLGGATMHTAHCGTSDYLARDDQHCIAIGRQIVANALAKNRSEAQLTWEEPKYDSEDLLGIVSNDLKIPFQVEEVIARLVDGSAFFPFKESYGPTLVCGWAKIRGRDVGILANNGVLTEPAARKGAQFIQLCNQQSRPLLFLQNITGFMVGSEAERAGIIKAGAQMINAVSNSTVPAITIMIGGSYGAGNYAMMGRAYKPRFLFSWPNHKIAVMGGAQLAGVLDIVKRAAAEKRGVPVDEEQLNAMKTMLSGKVEHDSTCWSATGRLFDDGVIDPRDTRDVLSFCFEAIHRKDIKGATSWGVFRH